MTMIIDAGVVIFILLSAVLAFSRGFLREVLTIAAWIGAAFTTAYGLPLARHYTHGYADQNLVADIITGSLIFIISIFVYSSLALVISNLIKKTVLGPADRTIGLLFGALRGFLLVCFGYFILSHIITEKPAYITNAYVYQPINIATTTLQSLILPKQLQTKTPSSHKKSLFAPAPENSKKSTTTRSNQKSKSTDTSTGYTEDDRTGIGRLILQLPED